jgi:hypothetical protein
MQCGQCSWPVLGAEKDEKCDELCEGSGVYEAASWSESGRAIGRL